ncbi:MAG: hypothetical protein HXY34_01350 [Candidatus Thorarchaeota archaeon]|nr:hypothetical protein [Candidatus Thorarchaeota archaeon]
MTDPDEYYPVNTLPPLAWTFDLYFRHNGRFRDVPIVEVILPAGHHKEMMKKKAEHNITVWISSRQMYVRARCMETKSCSFNSERLEARDRETLKQISWTEINTRKFFQIIRKWLLRLDLDLVLFIRALTTVCDRYVQIPLTTQYGKTFQKFDEYRRTRWPEDIKPDDMERFLEELLVRTSFWFQAAAAVKALRTSSSGG